MNRWLFIILDIGLTACLFTCPLFFKPMFKYVDFALTNNAGANSDEGLLFLLVAWFIVCAGSVYAILIAINNVIKYFKEFCNKFFI